MQIHVFPEKGVLGNEGVLQGDMAFLSGNSQSTAQGVPPVGDFGAPLALQSG